jgi:hypothetical protein
MIGMVAITYGFTRWQVTKKVARRCYAEFDQYLDAQKRLANIDASAQGEPEELACKARLRILSAGGRKFWQFPAQATMGSGAALIALAFGLRVVKPGSSDISWNAKT